MRKELILLLFCGFLSAQEIKIYRYVNGIKEIIPTTILKPIDKNKVEVYNVSNGVKEVVPIKIIENNKIYNVTNGVKEVIPTEEFILEPTSKDD